MSPFSDKENIHEKNLYFSAAVILLSLTIAPTLLAEDTPHQANPARQSEVLAFDTSSWKVLKQSRQLTVRVNPSVNLASYTKIQMGSVTYAGPAKAVTKKQAEELIANFHTQLSRQLQGNGLLQESSRSTQTLVLQAQITRIRRSHPWVNVLTTAAIFVPVDLGASEAIVYFVDAQTNAPVLSMETERCGQIYQVIPSFQALGQSKLLLKKESRMIMKELQELHTTSALSPNPSPTGEMAKLR